MDIVNTFGVSSTSVKRAVKRYREKGPKGFFQPRKTRAAQVLTPNVLAQAQQYLDEGKGLSEIEGLLNVKRDTLKKAIQAGRLQKSCVTDAEKKRIGLDDSPSDRRV